MGARGRSVAPLVPREVDEAGAAGRALEELLLDIAGGTRFRTTVARSAEGWVPRVTADAALRHIPEGTLVTIAPHNRPAETHQLNPVESRVPGRGVGEEWT